MIPCPYCERGFEKRAGLMRHVTASHHSEGAVPTNPGGAIEPVIPVDPDLDMNVRHYGGTVQLGQEYIDDHPEQFVEPETYAESLTDEQLAPGQDRYVDPPVELANGVHFDDVNLTMSPDGVTPGQLHPNPEQYTRIRALRRQGHQEVEAWMTVVGYPPAPRETPTEDSRPLRLQQIAFRVGNGYGYGPEAVAQAQMDARSLLRLVDVGAQAVDVLRSYGADDPDTEDLHQIIDRWNETLG